MADLIHLNKNADGDWEITRDGSAEKLTVTEGHLINLTQTLPRLVNDMLREKSGLKSSDANVTPFMQAKQFVVRSDSIGATILLQLKDMQGSETVFGFPPLHAQQLGFHLQAEANKLLSPADKPLPS